MARRPSKHLRAARPLAASFGHAEVRHDGAWVVAAQPAGRSVKEYLCPGCNRRIPPGASHVVVWPRLAPLGSTSPVEHRRHWHTACWRRRP